MKGDKKPLFFTVETLKYNIKELINVHFYLIHCYLLSYLVVD